MKEMIETAHVAKVTESVKVVSNEAIQEAKLKRLEEAVANFIGGEFSFKLQKELTETTKVRVEFDSDYDEKERDIICAVGFDIFFTSKSRESLNIESYISDKKFLKYVRKKYFVDLVIYLNSVFGVEIKKMGKFDLSETTAESTSVNEVYLQLVDNDLHVFVIENRDYEIER